MLVVAGYLILVAGYNGGLLATRGMVTGKNLKMLLTATNGSESKMHRQLYPSKKH